MPFFLDNKKCTKQLNFDLKHALSEINATLVLLTNYSFVQYLMMVTKKNETLQVVVVTDGSHLNLLLLLRNAI